MAKKKVKVLDAIVDGHEKDAVIEVDEKSAEMLVRNGYVKYVDEPKKSVKKDDDKQDDK